MEFANALHVGSHFWPKRQHLTWRASDYVENAHSGENLKELCTVPLSRSGFIIT